MGRRRGPRAPALGGPTGNRRLRHDAALHLLSLRMPGAREQTLAGPILRELRMRRTQPSSSSSASPAPPSTGSTRGWASGCGQDARGGGRGGHRRRDRRGRPRHSRFRHRRLRANGASPHHAVSDRIIEVGDVVVVDIGGPLSSGYNSDSTRTRRRLSPPEPTSRRSTALPEAQAAAVHAVRPGARRPLGRRATSTRCAVGPGRDAGRALHPPHRSPSASTCTRSRTSWRATTCPSRSG